MNVAIATQNVLKGIRFPIIADPEAEARIEKRRAGRTYMVGIQLHVEFPDGWVKHKVFPARWASMVETIDANTSGGWAYNAADSEIAFEDPADLTMFLLVYNGKVK